MANPQVENGHTQISNEILEHLVQIHLSPNEWQGLFCVIRKTYGFHKKVDRIANCQMVEATGLCKAVISRVMRGLQNKQMITKEGNLVGFQKDWDKWQQLAVSSTKVSSIANNGDRKVSSLVNREKLAVSSTPEPTQPQKLAEQLTNTKLAVSSTKLAVSSTKVSSPHVTQKIKDTIQKKIYINIYGEFSNVELSDTEHQKLIALFGEEGTKEWIETLSSYIASKGNKYKNHYATILGWDRKHKKEVAGGKARQVHKPSGWEDWKGLAGSGTPSEE